MNGVQNTENIEDELRECICIKGILNKQTKNRYSNKSYQEIKEKQHYKNGVQQKKL